MSALWGVGRVTEESLTRIGLRTVGDVAAMPHDALARARSGRRSPRSSASLANGVDPRDVHTTRDEKSIGHENTFGYDLTDPGELRRELLRLSDNVAVRLRKAGRRRAHRRR